jgi:hypothetical protein
LPPRVRASAIAFVQWSFETLASRELPAGKNPIGGRVIGSIRRECLDHVFAFDEHHLERGLAASCLTALSERERCGGPVTQTTACASGDKHADRLQARVEGGRVSNSWPRARRAHLCRKKSSRFHEDPASGKKADRSGLEARLESCGRATRRWSAGLTASAGACAILSTAFTI